MSDINTLRERIAGVFASAGALVSLVMMSQDTHTPMRQSVVLRFDCFRVIDVIVMPTSVSIDRLV